MRFKSRGQIVLIILQHNSEVKEQRSRMSSPRAAPRPTLQTSSIEFPGHADLIKLKGKSRLVVNECVCWRRESFSFLCASH